MAPELSTPGVSNRVNTRRDSAAVSLMDSDQSQPAGLITLARDLREGTHPLER